nr:cytochrome C oxidase subunit II [Bacteroidota bacterium]
MVDSQMVLNGQTFAYTCYAIVIILLMAWFGYQITRKGKGKTVSHKFFYTFVVFLTVLGVSLHIVTYNTIPWAPMDLNRADITADKVFDITVQNHEFQLPSEKLLINVGDKALFDVTSNDLTYGFGLFRSDNSMLFQMQVVPGHRNDILWLFDKPGVYTIRSTEYSGPKGAQMILKDVVVVSER